MRRPTGVIIASLVKRIAARSGSLPFVVNTMNSRVQRGASRTFVASWTSVAAIPVVVVKSSVSQGTSPVLFVMACIAKVNTCTADKSVLVILVISLALNTVGSKVNDGTSTANGFSPIHPTLFLPLPKSLPCLTQNNGWHKEFLPW